MDRNVQGVQLHFNAILFSLSNKHTFTNFLNKSESHDCFVFVL